ncbi:mechanosensitive ion channel family protein [Sphingosinicella rhizophila]|uniref:Mechanosensitive ion channel family protein n=1 Tax=Sphingosinicella rhizophila TaxID=3050082 RepID=A0ABU3Q554_9SPHN|nr:mechanosensitive ion channel family protein [Sphingosinicella sp. GR2756]MDT9598093.1 mechanosensitive ion channel family protein [Sphingosinicella sp. GR2756]
MNKQVEGDGPDAVHNISQQGATLVNEAAHWIGGNIVEIMLAAGAGIIIALLLLGIRSLGCRIMKRMGGDPRWPVIFVRVLSKTNIFFIVMCSAELVAGYAATPPAILKTINFLFVISAAFQAAIWARELVLGFIEHRVGPETEHSTLGSAIGIIRLLVTIALFAIAIILILDNLGVNVTGLVAGLGIGGIAIGLAAQGIFSDLFAALSIIFDKPFRRGDGVKFDQITGSVENIGLKTTRIRSLSGEQVIVSNAKLLEQQIHNFTHLEHRRFVLTLGIVYQTPPEVCARIPDMIKAMVEAHEDTTFVRCGMINFGDSSLDFEVQFDVHTTDYEKAFMTRSAICLDILKRFNEDKIDFAYPTQTSFTAAPDGNLVLPYPDVTLIAKDHA